MDQLSHFVNLAHTSYLVTIKYYGDVCYATQHGLSLESCHHRNWLASAAETTRYLTLGFAEMRRRYNAPDYVDPATVAPLAQPALLDGIAAKTYAPKPAPAPQPIEMFRGSEVLQVGVSARPQLSCETSRGSIALTLEVDDARTDAQKAYDQMQAAEKATVPMSLGEQSPDPLANPDAVQHCRKCGQTYTGGGFYCDTHNPYSTANIAAEMRQAAVPLYEAKGINDYQWVPQTLDNVHRIIAAGTSRSQETAEALQQLHSIGSLPLGKTILRYNGTLKSRDERRAEAEVSSAAPASAPLESCRREIITKAEQHLAAGKALQYHTYYKAGPIHAVKASSTGTLRYQTGSHWYADAGDQILDQIARQLGMTTAWDCAHPEEESTPAISRYEQRRAARVSALNRAAERTTTESERRLTTARSMANCIPFGQPIMIGHHSEQRDRRFRAKIDHNYRTGFALMDKAKEYRRRAQSAAANTAISSDDPEAVTKIAARIAELEAQRAHMKQANRIIQNKKLTNEQKIAALRQMGQPTPEALLVADFAGRIGFADYQLTNSSANIRRLKQRLAELARKAEDKPSTTQLDGLRIEENVEDNRLRLFFDGKPGKEMIDHLKRYGFKWSPTHQAWQRQLNNAARSSAHALAGIWLKTQQ
jgi:hypothetical protein